MNGEKIRWRSVTNDTHLGGLKDDSKWCASHIERIFMQMEKLLREKV